MLCSYISIIRYESKFVEVEAKQMDSNKKLKRKRIIIIAISTTLGLCFVLVIAVYLFFRGLINQMNLEEEDESDFPYYNQLMIDNAEGDAIYEPAYDLSATYDTASNPYNSSESNVLDSDLISDNNTFHIKDISSNKEDISQDNLNDVYSNTGNFNTGNANHADNYQENISKEGFLNDKNISIAAAGNEIEVENQDSPIEVIRKLEEEINKNVNNDDAIIIDDGVINLLLIGIDSMSEDDVGRSDSMILVSLNKRTDTIILTSLLRDIYVKIPGLKNNRLNSAYSYGGSKLLMRTIRDNFKLQVDKYIKVDFYAFVDIINAIGGITIEVTEEELAYINRYIRGVNKKRNVVEDKDCLTEAGLIHLNGIQALGYARIRYIGTDFGRTERQRKILNYIFNELRGLSLLEYNEILSSILPLVNTNLKEKEIFNHLLALPDYLDYCFVHWNIPMEGTYDYLEIRGMSVLGIDFDKNIRELQKKIYMYDD